MLDKRERYQAEYYIAYLLDTNDAQDLRNRGWDVDEMVKYLREVREKKERLEK